MSRLFQLGGMLVCTWRCMAPVDAVDIGGRGSRRGYAWVAWRLRYLKRGEVTPGGVDQLDQQDRPQ